MFIDKTGKKLRNFEFENKITEGKIQKIKEIRFEFNKITIIFQNLSCNSKKQLVIKDITSLSIQPDDEKTFDVMDYETLIGYDYSKDKELYTHTLRTDTYEIIIRSYQPPELTILS